MPLCVLSQTYHPEDLTPSDYIGVVYPRDNVLKMFNGNVGFYLDVSESGDLRLHGEGESTYGTSFLQLTSPDGKVDTLRFNNGLTERVVFESVSRGIWSFVFVNDFFDNMGTSNPDDDIDRNLFVDYIKIEKDSPVVYSSVTVTWNKNTEDDLEGYRVYWGTSSRNYSNNFYVGLDTTYRTNDVLALGFEYYFAVTAADTASNESGYSNEVSIFLYYDDVIAPKVLAITAISSDSIQLTFDEEVTKESGELLSNYEISNGISVIGAFLDSNKVILKTSPHSSNNYEIIVNNIKDMNDNPIKTDTRVSYVFYEDDIVAPSIPYLIKVERNN